MITLHAKLGSDRMAEALHRAPGIIERYAEAGLDEAAAKIARTAKLEAPKASTVLTNSIKVRAPSRFKRIISPGTDYADYVNEGTGIYGPKHSASGKLPPVQSILDWIRWCRIKPRTEGMTEHALAFLIAHGIARKGTRKNAFMDRAAEKSGELALAAVNRQLDLGMAEALNA